MESEEKRSLAFYDGQPGVILKIVKKGDSNAVRVIDSVRAEVERINRDLLLLRLHIVFKVDPVDLKEQLPLFDPVSLAYRNLVDIPAGPAGDVRALLRLHIPLNRNLLHKLHPARLHLHDFDHLRLFQLSFRHLPVSAAGPLHRNQRKRHRDD